MADANFEQFFGGGSLGVGPFPFFVSKLNKSVTTSGGGKPFGFNDDGDWFDLSPNSGTGNLVYKSNTNVSVWTKTPANIDASAETWLSFTYDSVDNLVYCIAVDDATDTMYLASINSAGTVVNIGNFNPAFSFIASSHSWGLVTGSPNMIRASEGSGDFTVHLNEFTLVINSSTGALVSETPQTNDSEPGIFVSSLGVIFTLLGRVNVLGTLVQIINIGKSHPDTANSNLMFDYNIPVFIGLPAGGGLLVPMSHLNWGGDVLLSLGGVANIGSIRFDKAVYDDAVNVIARNFSII